MTNTATRIVGKTKRDNLYLDSSSWYIDGEAVTASAESLNNQSNLFLGTPISVINTTTSPVVIGDPLHINGYSNGYYTVEFACAGTGKFCQLFALANAAPNEIVAVASSCSCPTSSHITAPLVEGQSIYLGNLPGTISQNPPTENDAFIQVVGRASSTSTLQLDASFRELVEISSQQMSPTIFSGFPVTESVSVIADSIVSTSVGVNSITQVDDIASALAGPGLSAEDGRISVVESHLDLNTGLIKTILATHLPLGVTSPLSFDLGQIGVDGMVLGARFLFEGVTQPYNDISATFRITTGEPNTGTKVVEDYIFTPLYYTDIIGPGTVTGTPPTNIGTLSATDHIYLYITSSTGHSWTLGYVCIYILVNLS